MLCERFPTAELFTLVHVPGSVSPTIERLPIHTSFVQRLPLVGRFYRQYLPLFPIAVERWDFEGFDLVLSVSHCCVKSVVRPAAARHLCYCLTPMRYAWDQFDAYFGPDRIGRLASAPDASGDGAAGPVGPRDGGPRGPLCRYLSLCCGEDPPIL